MKKEMRTNVALLYDYYEVYDELTGKSLMIYAINQEDAESISEELDFKSFKNGDEYNPKVK